MSRQSWAADPRRAAAQLRQAKRTLLMGILNITEDSFSDGGLWLSEPAAAEHGRQLAAQGADIIDIGAESTRPGAVRVPEEVELARVLAAVRDLRGTAADGPGQAPADGSYGSYGPDGDSGQTSAGVNGPVLSIDTTRHSVAAAALDAGAVIINDVSGGRLDAGLPRLVAERGCLYIVQHWRGWLSGGVAGVADSNSAVYPHGLLTDVYDELMRQVDDVLAAGVAPEQVVIDPGLGFSKPAVAYNLPLMTHLDRFRASGYPVLIGASRKRFVSGLLNESGRVAGGPAAAAVPDQARKDLATAVLSALCALSGAWAVRVHDVQASADALRVVQAWEQAQTEGDEPLPSPSDDLPASAAGPRPTSSPLRLSSMGPAESAEAAEEGRRD